jgi:hypothetical protein
MALLTYEAGRGTKTYTDVLDDLGISLDDLKQQTPEQKLNTFMNAIAGVEDPTRKAALATKVFGKSGMAMLPMLTKGTKGLADMKSEADRLGVVIDPKQAAGAVEFKDQITRLKASIFGLSNSVVSFDKINAGIGMLIGKVVALRDNPAFVSFVSKVKTGAVEVVQKIYGISKAIYAFAQNSGTNLIKFAALFGGVALAFKSGLAVPLLKLTGVIVKGLITGLASPVGIVLAGLAATFAAFKFGEALEKTFDLSTYVVRGLTHLTGFGKKIGAFFKSIGPGFKENFAAATSDIDADTNQKLSLIGDPKGNGKGQRQRHKDRNCIIGDPELDDIAGIGADGDKFAMRHVDHAHDAEGDGQSDRRQHQH